MLGGLSADLKRVLGHDGFIALADAFGGTRLYVPHKVTDDHEIVRAIGAERAARLTARYAPATIRIPLARKDRAVHYRVHGLSNGQIARKLGMTEPGVEQMFARMDTPPVKGSAQLALFDI